MRKFWKTVGKVVAFPVTGPAKLVRKGVEKTTMSLLMTAIRSILTAAGSANLAISDEVVSQVASALVVLGTVGWQIITTRKANVKVEQAEQIIDRR